MNYRNIFRFMVLILGILLANLLTMWIDQFMLSYKWRYASHASTLIGMGIVVVIYYPLFTRIDKWATKIGDRFLKAGKKMLGREIGSFFAFLAALLVLFYLYGREWFNSNVLRSLIESF